MAKRTIKPFESKRARAVAIPMQIYAFWYLFTNFLADANGAITVFLLFFFGGALIGWIINVWVRRRKNEQAEYDRFQRQRAEKQWEERDTQSDVEGRLSALEAERDQLRQIADEARRRADRIEAEYSGKSFAMDRNAAMEVFDLKEGFSQGDLAKRRRDLLVKVHPDQGGSNNLTRLVNDAYETLK